jgi:pimeloyl-ACP methyl ester carboxylesterase
MPYLRGFGPTRFLSAATMRNGRQAALGRDLIDLLDALGIQRAILAGYDWGGLSSCVASALWPEHVTGLVSYAGYHIIDVKRLGHAFERGASLLRDLFPLLGLQSHRIILAPNKRPPDQ